MFALTVALGLRYLGVLLMGSLIIIPAATGKRLSRNLTQMLTIRGGDRHSGDGGWFARCRTLPSPNGSVHRDAGATVFFLSFVRGELSPRCSSLSAVFDGLTVGDHNRRVGPLKCRLALHTLTAIAVAVFDGRRARARPSRQDATHHASVTS
jgi:hypothetical protein